MKRSKGERRIRVDFNPSNSDQVSKTKEIFASIIDGLQQNLESHIENGTNFAERQRLIATAQTQVEQAAMWVVKALTPIPSEDK